MTIGVPDPPRPSGALLYWEAERPQNPPAFPSGARRSALQTSLYHLMETAYRRSKPLCIPWSHPPVGAPNRSLTRCIARQLALQTARACTIAIIHACTTAMVHACTIAIVHACSVAIVHACSITKVHACTIAVVHVSCPIGLVVHELSTGGPGGEAPDNAGGFGNRRPPNV